MSRGPVGLGPEAIAAALSKSMRPHARRVAVASLPVVASGSPLGASEAPAWVPTAQAWDNASYKERASSWSEDAWTARPGIRAYVGAQGVTRVRGPFREHRSGNGVRGGASVSVVLSKVFGGE